MHFFFSHVSRCGPLLCYGQLFGIPHATSKYMSAEKPVLILILPALIHKGSVQHCHTNESGLFPPSSGRAVGVPDAFASIVMRLASTVVGVDVCTGYTHTHTHTHTYTLTRKRVYAHGSAYYVYGLYPYASAVVCCTGLRFSIEEDSQ